MKPRLLFIPCIQNLCVVASSSLAWYATAKQAKGLNGVFASIGGILVKFDQGLQRNAWLRPRGGTYYLVLLAQVLGPSGQPD